MVDRVGERPAGGRVRPLVGRWVIVDYSPQNAEVRERRYDE
jgi:hypothetical protein